METDKKSSLIEDIAIYVVLDSIALKLLSLFFQHFNHGTHAFNHFCMGFRISINKVIFMSNLTSVGI